MVVTGNTVIYTCFLQRVIIVPPLSITVWNTLINYFLILIKWIDLINVEVLPWCQKVINTSLKFSNFSHFLKID